jgi:surface protein
MKNKHYIALILAFSAVFSFGQTQGFGGKVKIGDTPVDTSIDSLLTINTNRIVNHVSYSSFVTKILGSLTPYFQSRGENTAFEFTWKTDNTGTSNDNQATLPFTISPSLDCVVTWGDADGSTTILNSASSASDLTHTYSGGAGTKSISISGTGINGLSFVSNGDKLKILNVSNVGNLDLTRNRAFMGCTNLTWSATDAPTISVTTLSETFRECTNFNGNINNWDVSNVTTMALMFYAASSFNQPLNNWNTGSVTNMAIMFGFASSFNQPLNSWDMSNVQDMGDMFFQATSFNQPLNKWNVSSATDMFRVFGGTNSFDQDISGWDINQVDNLRNFILNVTLSTANYDLLLVSWDAQGAMAYSGTVAFGSSTYTLESAASTARASLINKWGAISDGGGVPSVLKAEIEAFGFVTGAHTTDTNTQLSQAEIEAFGFVTGAHTTDTNTQLSQAEIEAFGFVTGAHTTDTNTQLSQAEIEAFGFVTGAHTVNTNTQLSQAEIEAFGFVTGAHTVDTNTQLSQAEIEAFGFVTGSGGSSGTNLTDSDIEAMGFVKDALTQEVDGSITNEIQRLNKSGDFISLSQSGHIIEMDGSITNEIQTLSKAGNLVSLSLEGGTVDVSGSGWVPLINGTAIPTITDDDTLDFIGGDHIDIAYSTSGTGVPELTFNIDDTDFVKTTTNQTIAGDKTFLGSSIFKSSTKYFDTVNEAYTTFTASGSASKSILTVQGYNSSNVLGQSDFRVVGQIKTTGSISADSWILATDKVRIQGSNAFLEFHDTVETQTATIAYIASSDHFAFSDDIYGSNDITAVSTVRANDFKINGLNTAPASATAIGTTGEIRYTSDYIYVCTAPNSWKRTALLTWQN